MKKKVNNSLIIIILVSFGHLWHDIFTAITTPLVPIIKENFNLNYVHAGWILVAVKLPSLLSAYIAGFSEKHNPKWLIIICPLITSIAVTLLGVAGNFYIVLILVFIAGLSAAGFHVPAPTLLKRTTPNRIGLAMSCFQIGGEAARTLGPLFLVPVLAVLGFSRMYFLIPVSLVVSYIFYLTFNKVEVKMEKKAIKRGSVIETVKEGWPIFLIVGLISIQKGFLSTLMKGFLPLYMQSRGESILNATLSLSIVQGATLLGIMASGPLLDKFGAKKILTVVVSMGMVLILIFINFPALPFYPMIFLIGFFSFASMPGIYTIIQNFGFKYPTTANGVFMSLNFGISSLILILGGWLSDLFTIETTYRLFSYSSLTGIPILLLMWFRRNLRKK